LRALLADAGMRAQMGQAARARSAAICDPSVEMRRLRQALAAHTPVADEPLAALAG